MKRKLLFTLLGVSILMGSQMATVNTFANEQGIEVVAENLQGLENVKIKLRGREIAGLPVRAHGFDVVFNTDDMKIKFENEKGGKYLIHGYWADNTYISLKLSDAEGNLKEELILKGNDTTQGALTKKGTEGNIFNGINFEYGDILEVYHAEGDRSPENSRYQIEGNIENQIKGTTTHKYKILETGLREVFEYPNVIEMRGLGIQLHKYNGFNIKIDTLNKQIKIEDLIGKGYEIHPYFNEKYMGIKLMSKDGNVKAEFELNGKNEFVEKVLDSNINGAEFEYGDYLEVFHREGHKSDNKKAPFTVTGTIQNEKQFQRTHKYEITPAGFVEM